jgi:pimeloyl-ACP methyl ester carboxylesterase
VRQIVLVTIALTACFGLNGQPESGKLIPPLGKMVDAGGHRLHLNCTGEGSPTVVLESGTAEFSMVWALVQPGIAQFTRVCSYDRAGYAWSDAGPLPRTISQIVYELHTALGNAAEKGPYVLVGATVGGPIMRVFANTYPADVSGMVLVDSTHENGFIIRHGKEVRIGETSENKAIPPVQTAMKEPRGTPEPLAVRPTKASAFVKESPLSKLPLDLQKTWMIAKMQSKYNEAVVSEFAFLPEEMNKLFAATAANPQPLGSKPLIVLIRDVEFRSIGGEISAADLASDRKKLQGQLARLSTNGKLTILKEPSQEIALDRPDAVVSAVHEVFQAAKPQSGGAVSPRSQP